MDKVNHKTGALAVLAIGIAAPVAGWSQPYSGGTDYKITLPGAQPAFSWQKTDDTDAELPHSEMLFKLSPVTVEDPETAENNTEWNSDISLQRIDFLSPGEARMQGIHHGFSYSAGIALDHQEETPASGEEFLGDSHFISSRQLGIHYGRLGSVNYSGVDLSFRQFKDKAENSISERDDKELWSLGVTTGRRFALTGLDTSDPIWTVSLRGQFNLIDKPNDAVVVENQQWYLSPGLHWESNSFQMSADVLMPFLQSGEYEEETDYRIRAKIQKRF